jgi:hypothetical protein
LVSIVVIRRTHGDGPVFIRGERMENERLTVALWGLRGYISRSKISSNPLVSQDRDGSPIRLFHAGADQELSDPEGAR